MCGTLDGRFSVSMNEEYYEKGKHFNPLEEPYFLPVNNYLFFSELRSDDVLSRFHCVR
jgi:hypothetical protein